MLKHLHSASAGGILVSTPSFGTKAHTGTPSHVRHPSEDFMLRSNSSSSRSAVASETPAVVPSTAPVDTPTQPAVPAEPTPQPEAAEQSPMAVDEPAPEGPKEEGEEVSSDVTENTKGKEQQPDSAVAVEATTKEGGVAAVADLLDPATFTLDPSQGTPAKQKITRESFMNPPGSLAQTKPDPKDPLSQLDPLWSLKKGKE